MGGVTALYRQLPKRKQPATQAKAKVLRDTGNSTNNEPQLGHTVSVSVGNGPSTILSSPKHKHTSSKSSFKKEKKEKEKKLHNRSFSLDREKPEMLQTLASSSVASTNLLNALKRVNRETHRVSEDAECLNRFETCKLLRRQILRYIQHVESEEYLGSLIHANEELVTALMAFEVLDKSIDYDSDSDQDVLESGWSPDRDDLNESFAGLVVNPPKPARPPRPLSISVPSSSQQKYISASESETEEDDDDENNPFGDRNAIRTPGLERTEPTWYVSSAVFLVRIVPANSCIGEKFEPVFSMSFITPCLHHTFMSLMILHVYYVDVYEGKETKGRMIRIHSLENRSAGLYPSYFIVSSTLLTIVWTQKE